MVKLFLKKIKIFLKYRIFHILTHSARGLKGSPHPLQIWKTGPLINFKNVFLLFLYHPVWHFRLFHIGHNFWSFQMWKLIRLLLQRSLSNVKFGILWKISLFGAVHKWCYGLRGNEYRGFCDNSTKTLLLKNDDGGRGCKNHQKLRDVIYGQSLFLFYRGRLYMRAFRY